MKTLFQRPDCITDPLYVITPIFNPIRWRSRWKLYEDFARRCAAAGAILYTVEAAFGDREFALSRMPDSYANDERPKHAHEGLIGFRDRFVNVRVSNELWLKENLINVGVQHLPHDWKYVAWVDSDVTFSREDWANETIQQLQHYKFVQMWSQYQDLTPHNEVHALTRSFMECYLHGGDGRVGKSVPNHRDHDGYGSGPRRGYPGAPGLAWACRRDAWDAVGGLIDWTILGAGDWYMAHALVGKLSSVSRPQAHSTKFVQMMQEWEARAERHIRRNVGVVKGLALHHWHGSKKHRKYRTRDQILVDCGFDPTLDLKRDSQGVYQLSDQHTARSIRLRDELRAYFRQRNEDGTDL